MTQLTLPTLPILLGWAAWLALGVLLGGIYFHMLRRSVDLLVGDGSALWAVLLTLGRLAIVGTGLALASLQGAMPLLLAALGLLIGRKLVMRRQERTS